MKQNDPLPTCSLYYAPSTIPNAGWGLYAGTDYKEGDPIASSSPTTTTEIGEDYVMADIIIPIFDNKKTFPFRGQQKFLPWLAYVWCVSIYFEIKDSFFFTCCFFLTSTYFPNFYSSSRCIYIIIQAGKGG